MGSLPSYICIVLVQIVAVRIVVRTASRFDASAEKRFAGVAVVAALVAACVPGGADNVALNSLVLLGLGRTDAVVIAGCKT